MFALSATLSMLVATPAHATLQGSVGKIAFERDGEIWTMDPDGTGLAQSTNNSAPDAALVGSSKAAGSRSKATVTATARST